MKLRIANTSNLTNASNNHIGVMTENSKGTNTIGMIGKEMIIKKIGKETIINRGKRIKSMIIRVEIKEVLSNTMKITGTSHLKGINCPEQILQIFPRVIKFS